VKLHGNAKLHTLYQTLGIDCLGRASNEVGPVARGSPPPLGISERRVNAYVFWFARRCGTEKETRRSSGRQSESIEFPETENPEPQRPARVRERRLTATSVVCG